MDKINPGESVFVSVIVPCYNEERTIQLLLKALLKQSFPLDKMEVVIADAESEDQTIEKIREFSALEPSLNIRVVKNFQRTIPAAVNLAAREAKGKYLVRLDAHSIPDKNYIKNSVDLLESGQAQNVGGIWDIQPGNQTCVAKAIARAASHTFGAGDAGYRLAAKAGFVETVPFGAFAKETFENLGGFNEDLLSNEDYEFNARLKKAGGKIWLDPSIKSQYFARKNFSELARQYSRYGYWKFRMLRSHPSTLRWRQAIPPIFVSIILGVTLLSLFWQFARIILAAILMIYLTSLLLVSISEVIKTRKICYLNLIVAFAIMHLCWGGSFIFSMVIHKTRRIN